MMFGFWQRKNTAPSAEKQFRTLWWEKEKELHGKLFWRIPQCFYKPQIIDRIIRNLHKKMEIRTEHFYKNDFQKLTEVLDEFYCMDYVERNYEHVLRG